MSKFKRTEIIKFPSHNVTEDDEKLFWSRLSDDYTIQEYGAIGTVDICPSDPNILAATSHNKVQLINVATLEIHKSLNKFKETCFSGRFRHDGGLLCAGTGEGAVKVFDVNSKATLRVLTGHTAAVQHCQFQFGQGRSLVSWSDDSTVRTWDLAAEVSVASISYHTDYVRAGSLCSQQPDLILSGGYDHKVALWDVRDPEHPSLAMDHGAPVEAVLVLPGGGLVASVGGQNVKIWDLLGGGKLLNTLPHHHKTVTSVTVSRNGKCLVTGSLDRQVVWTDLSTFRQVYSKPFSSSVMSVALGGEDDYLVVGMLDGLIQIHKRKEERMVDGMMTGSRRYNRIKNHKYLQYTQYTPTIGDQVVTDGNIKDIELKHDHLLRKFEYSKALDMVLKPFVARKKPEYTYSLLMELVRREALVRALSGREEKQLCLLLQFLNRYLADSRFSRLCIHVSNTLIDLYLPHHGMSSRVDNLFEDMRRKLEREATYIETLMELTGAVDVVLTSANNKQMVGSGQPPVDHRNRIIHPDYKPFQKIMKEIYTSKTSDEDEASNDDGEGDNSEEESEEEEEDSAESESIKGDAEVDSTPSEDESEENENTEDRSEEVNSPASFEELGVSKWILHQLSGLGISRPSPVQANCIAPILAGRDCVGIAKTGQGKTLAFAIPILQTLAVDPYGIYAVILTPTRELAGQIGDSFRSVGKAGMNLREVVVTGGRDTIKQSLDLERRPHVIIATPGRLGDHIRTNSTFSLSRVKYLVLDEADRLLEGGFDEDLGTIISALPSSRQTLLFTATNSSSISSVIKSCKNDPFIWTSPDLSASSTVDKLDQKYLLTPPEARNSYLTQLLLSKKDENSKASSIVFCRTCRQAELIGSLLSKVGLKSSTLHSVKPQKERMASLASFKSGHTKILVATDVASRGLDIHEVDLVVNHNVPRDPVDYVHRVGRTARAGRGGEAVSLVTPHDVGLVHAIEAHTGVKWTELELKDERVSEIMVQVNTLYREAEMKLEKEDWGKNREINVRKRKIEQGIDPDVEKKMKQKAKRKFFKNQKKERLKMKTMKSDKKL